MFCESFYEIKTRKGKKAQKVGTERRCVRSLEESELLSKDESKEEGQRVVKVAARQKEQHAKEQKTR